MPTIDMDAVHTDGLSGFQKAQGLTPTADAAGATPIAQENPHQGLAPNIWADMLKANNTGDVSYGRGGQRMIDGKLAPEPNPVWPATQQTKAPFSLWDVPQKAKSWYEQLFGHGGSANAATPTAQSGNPTPQP
jgi:hypothetical protein